TLFRAGERPDALYVVLSGCLGVFLPDRSPQQIRGRIVAGGTVGEMGMISGRPRTAHVVALRDTELARVSRDSFDRVFGQHPDAMLRIARLTVDRLEQSQSRSPVPLQGARTFTLIPQSLEVDVGGFATEFVKALSACGRTELVWSVRAAAHTSHWFHRLEAANDYVVYVADSQPPCGAICACGRPTPCCCWLARKAKPEIGQCSRGSAAPAWRPSGPSSFFCTMAISCAAQPRAGSLDTPRLLIITS